MKLRRSFFNMTIVKKDLTRFLPVWLVYSIFCVIGILSDATVDGGILLSSLARTVTTEVILNGFIAFLAGLCVFGDLFNTRMCNAVHTLPVRRETWFASHLLAGLLFWLMPNALRILLYLPVLGSAWFVALLWILSNAVQYLFFLTLAAVCALCTGNKVGMTMMYGITNFASLILYWLVDSIYSPFMKGIKLEIDGFTEFCPGIRVMGSELIRVRTERSEEEWYVMDYVFDGLGKDWWYIGAVALVSVALIVLGILAYRKRKLENAGEFVVFRPLQPVVWALLTLLAGVIFQSLGLLFDDKIVSLIIGLLIGGMLAMMLVTRTPKTALKGLKNGAILTAVVGFSVIVVAADPIGITHFVPEVAEVEYVSVVKDYNYDDEYMEYANLQTFSDPETIEKVVHAHELLTEEGFNNLSIISGPIGEIHLSYQLKNGKEVVRRYYYYDDSDAAKAIAKFWDHSEFYVDLY